MRSETTRNKSEIGPSRTRNAGGRAGQHPQARPRVRDEESFRSNHRRPFLRFPKSVGPLRCFLSAFLRTPRRGQALVAARPPSGPARASRVVPKRVFRARQKRCTHDAVGKSNSHAVAPAPRGRSLLKRLDLTTLALRLSPPSSPRNANEASFSKPTCRSSRGNERFITVPRIADDLETSVAALIRLSQIPRCPHSVPDEISNWNHS